MQNMISNYIELWDLEPDGKPFETPSSLMLFVIHDDQPAVLKIFKHHSDEKRSAEILSLYGGHGAVGVLRSSDHALLLERVVKGETLAQLALEEGDDQATQVFCEIVSKLHEASFDASLIEPVCVLARGFDLYLASGDQTLLPKRVARAKSIYEDLCKTQGRKVLLHGDLHHGNILHDEQKGWLCIDPKGYVGEAEFEISAFLKNPRGTSYYAAKEIVERRIALIAQRLKLNPKRIILWSYSLCVLSIIWSIEDSNCEAEWLRLLDNLEQMAAS